ncbi:4Fe-4S binding protein [Thermofilum pendens]|uniref:4Fe-4S ferredoxin, iron-sulfur binding domain protein n=1 Tax=Thermofilum pendens (strain DSM 2475 / Hrk 5) TaxID=368408 RepID=A1S154_THEPD|nr:4Fe-4S binding protein [Thermofilum pendens]ABL79184.1 4Fe-4S ferredoxin, iron-sulfur binding domain protein [Thermofilum pendens Hrk 5]
MSAAERRRVPRVVKRRKLKPLRYAFQAVSFVALVLLVPIGVLAIPAGICSIPLGSFRVDCLFGTAQRILSSPLNVALWLLLTFAAVPLLGSLLLGRFFCGLMCPVGTLLDLFGKVKRVNFLGKLRLNNKHNKYAVAASFAAASTLTGFPAFCTICPIRGLCTAYGSLKGVELALAAAPVVLEFSEKRAWCRYFCPVGAVLGAVGFRKVFGVKIDTEKCINCKACMRVCPTGAITEDSFKTGEVSRTECIMCLRCYDVCMYDALKVGVLPRAHG